MATDSFFRWYERGRTDHSAMKNLQRHVQGWACHQQAHRPLPYDIDRLFQQTNLWLTRWSVQGNTQGHYAVGLLSVWFIKESTERDPDPPYSRMLTRWRVVAAIGTGLGDHRMDDDELTRVASGRGVEEIENSTDQTLLSVAVGGTRRPLRVSLPACHH